MLEHGTPGFYVLTSGKWRFRIDSNSPLEAVSLLRDPNGYLTNLSNSTHGTSDTLPQ